MTTKAQPKRVVGYEGEQYPGAYRWPVYAVKCPGCGKWVREYGEVSETIDGTEHFLCLKCGDVAFPPCPDGEQATDRDQV